jgi:hypothetical protein
MAENKSGRGIRDRHMCHRLHHFMGQQPGEACFDIPLMKGTGFVKKCFFPVNHRHTDRHRSDIDSRYYIIHVIISYKELFWLFHWVIQL